MEAKEAAYNLERMFAENNRLDEGSRKRAHFNHDVETFNPDSHLQ